MAERDKPGDDVQPAQPGEEELRTALAAGDPHEIRVLIDAGANIHYKRAHGYDAIIDAVHGRDVRRDSRLLDLLRLLIAERVELSVITSYNESVLRVLSRLGRFDAVRLLLDAGADKAQLGFTPLMEAVAFGSISEVTAAISKDALEQRDWWSRTPWLIAVLVGDIDKANLLREAGTHVEARGRCDCPPLFYAVEGHHPEMLRWLLQLGADVHQTDEFGRSALIEAVENDDLECVNILLEAGADIEVDSNGTALSRAYSRPIIMRLLEVGANPADANQRVILGLHRAEDDNDTTGALAAITAKDYRAGRPRRFGKKNPEQMHMRLWNAMIRAGVSAYRARERFEEQPHSFDQAVWCAQRFGQSLTLLPDGRAIQIGGEHEDSYDPDFCIYNDVFVHQRDGTISIYGYPESVFPPTDFHTATMIEDYIYVIGSLGYAGTRRYGETPVYRLNIHSLTMEHVPTRGHAPGWIYKHRAALTAPRAIQVWSGMVATQGPNDESHDLNPHTYVLDLDEMTWERSDSS